ncbi:MAG: ParB/RepB/Spo0J family partition protein [Chitinophagaceae bacterium]|nr:MAG: ParB/RepB/Spo0J family partition protein [Chitinophagaceae bacterium]
MSKQKEALGKGIRALLEGLDSDVKNESIPEQKKKISGSIIHIPLSQIEINPFQPRVDFDKEKLGELSDSIVVHGVIQPITVRMIQADKYQLIAGERRLRASKMAGLTEVPAFIRTADDQEMLEMALIENIQREDLNSIEIAINYKRLMDECEINHEKLGERLGKNRSTITNYLRLLKLPPEIQSGIKTKKISMGHARAIINVEDPVTQLAIYKDILKRDLSVRKVEEITRNLNDKTKPKDENKKADLSPELKKIEDGLTSLFSTKVRIKKKSKGGEINISFYSKEDLNRILDFLEK